MGKLTIKKTLGILLAILFLASVTATAVNAQASARAACSSVSKDTTPSGCTYTIKCSSEGSEGEQFLWSFGDGKTSASENPSHIYDFEPQCRTHNIKLTVSDRTDNSEDTATTQVDP